MSRRRRSTAFAALATARRRAAPELAWVVDAAGLEDREINEPDTETLLELVAHHALLHLVTLAEILPQARLVDEERRPFEEAAGGDANAHAAPRLAGGDDPTSDDELPAELDAFVRSHEERWVDEPVPALGGLTPRRAAEDPTRRHELRSPLDEMERIELP